MVETCKNTSKQNMWASLKNASITIRGSPCVSTTINRNHLQVQRLVDPERNSASSQNLNTSHVQNLVPTTIQSTTMWSSPAQKREEMQEYESQPYRKNTQENGFKSQNGNAKNTPMCRRRWRSCCSRRRRRSAGSKWRRRAWWRIYDGGSRDWTVKMHLQWWRNGVEAHATLIFEGRRCCWYRAAECLSMRTKTKRRMNWVLNKNCAFKVLPFNIKDQLKLFPLF